MTYWDLQFFKANFNSDILNVKFKSISLITINFPDFQNFANF